MRTIDEMLEGDSLEDLLALCRFDFKVFSERIVHVVNGEEVSIQPFHLEWVRMFLENRRSVVIAARGTGKSTILGVLFPLWISFYSQSKNFLIVSNAMHQSTDIMDAIRNTIEDNELLRKLKPERAEATWSRTELTTTTKCKIVAKPYNENIRGGHYDFCLCDEASLYQDPSIFTSSIVPTLNARKGNLMVIGTPLHPGDMLMQLSENKEYVVARYPILTGNQSIWPSRFPVDYINQIKNEMNSIDFAREYLCELKDDETVPFPYSIVVKSLDTSITVEDSAGAGTYYVGVDLALSSKGDYSAFVVVKNEGGRTVLSNIYRHKGLSFDAQVSLLKEINQKFRPAKFFVDKSTFGEIFYEELSSANLPVVGFSFTQENRNAIINNTIRKFQEGKIAIPYGNPDSQNVVDPLIKELVSFVSDKTRTGLPTYTARSKHDDTAIAFFLAVRAASEERPFLSYFRTGTWDDLNPNQFQYI